MSVNIKKTLSNSPFLIFINCFHCSSLIQLRLHIAKSFDQSLLCPALYPQREKARIHQTQKNWTAFTRQWYKFLAGKAMQVCFTRKRHWLLHDFWMTSGWLLDDFWMQFSSIFILTLNFGIPIQYWIEGMDFRCI